MRERYNAQKEHEIIGQYPCIKGFESDRAKQPDGRFYIPESPQYYRPIPTYQNFKMLFQGKTPYWMPNNGWVNCDVNEFRPRQHPDNVANHQCLDGGDYVDFKSMPLVQRGWFDLPLEWEPKCMGASVRPGNPILTDMNDWKSVLHFPNLDDINWDEMEEMNRLYLASDKVNQLGIQLGLWERMMCLMDVSNAAIALIDEDQEDAVHAFLDKLSDLYCDYIKRVSKIGRIDSVMFHDDWGTNKAPFFSLKTAEKIFVPPLKKIVDCCHELDIIFEHHCCGNAEALVPAMVKTGSDYWCPQAEINNVDRIIDTYKDEHIRFSVYSPTLPRGASEAEIREIGHAFVEKYKNKGVLFTQSVRISDPNHDPSLYPIFKDAVYEHSRIAYQDCE